MIPAGDLFAVFECVFLATCAEATAVQNGCTPDDARMKLALQDAQDEDLADELRDRGYTGTITKTKTIII